MVCSEANDKAMSSGDRSGEPLRSPTIGTAWLTTRRLGMRYIEPVLIRFTIMESVLAAVVRIGDDLAIGVDGGAHFGQLRRAVIVPPQLIPAHELHADGAAHGLRYDRGGLRRILVAAVAEGAGSFVVLDPHALDGQPEQRRKHGAGRINVLR